MKWGGTLLTPIDLIDKIDSGYRRVSTGGDRIDGATVSSVPALRSLPMRFGARGLRGVLMRRMTGERYRRGYYFAKAT